MKLALGVANEWDAQTCPIKGLQPATMPITSLAYTALDQIAVDPSSTIDNCIRYLPTDSAS